MLLALPLFGRDLAPRFCAAGSILLVRVTDHRAERSRELDVSGLPIERRLQALGDLRVDHLICCGFNRRFLFLAHSLGIRVTWGQSGPAEQVVADLIAGRLPPPVPPGPGQGCGMGFGRGGGPGRGWRRDRPREE
ncbi:MAG: hypothetical protein ABIO70_00310 [Pseudomonadota bacterium]